MMRLRSLFLVVTLMVFAAACGGERSSGDAASDTSSADDAAFAVEESFEPDVDLDFAADEADAMDAEDAPARQVSTTGSAAGIQPTQPLPDLGRDIVYTAHLDLGSTDVSTATRDAIATVERNGGFLFSQDTTGGAGGRSVLVFKVLPEYFHTVLGELGSIGAVRSQSVSADDVTAIVVDLESRITTAEASVERLRNLLENADDIEIIASLENQLLDRETTLEQLRGQLRSVRNQVDLATITVSVSELLDRPALAIDTVAYLGHDGGFDCPDAGRISRVASEEALTICYLLTNVGDTDLVDLELADPVLDATIEDLLVVDGSRSVLAPGERLVVAHEIELEQSIRMRTTATAVALDADGNPLDAPVEATAPRLRIDVEGDDSGLPGFGEVLERSWEVLVTIAVLIALAGVAVAPFALLAAVLGPVLWFFLRRGRRSSTVDIDPSPDEADRGDADSPTEESTVSF